MLHVRVLGNSEYVMSSLVLGVLLWSTSVGGLNLGKEYVERSLEGNRRSTIWIGDLSESLHRRFERIRGDLIGDLNKLE
jgi:hypothetical protein